MSENVHRTWQEEARDRLRSVNGLSGNDARLHFVIDQNATARAGAIEEALSKTAGAIEHQADVSQNAGNRLEQALGHAAQEAQQASGDLTKAIHALVEASNESTKTMARLQRWIIALTAVYVILTAIMAFATLRSHP